MLTDVSAAGGVSDRGRCAADRARRLGAGGSGFGLCFPLLRVEVVLMDDLFTLIVLVGSNLFVVALVGLFARWAIDFLHSVV